MGHCRDPSAGGVQKISDLLVVTDGWMDVSGWGVGPERHSLPHFYTPFACSHSHMKSTNNEIEGEINV